MIALMKKPRLAPGVKDRCRELLAQGQLQKKEIARMLKISRGTVYFEALKMVTAVPDVGVLEPGETFHPEGVRCGTCGGKVKVTPCRNCRCRNVARSLPRPAA